MKNISKIRSGLIMAFAICGIIGLYSLYVAVPVAVVTNKIIYPLISLGFLIISALLGIICYILGPFDDYYKEGNDEK